jgi:hypothetical protein
VPRDLTLFRGRAAKMGRPIRRRLVLRYDVIRGSRTILRFRKWQALAVDCPCSSPPSVALQVSFPVGIGSVSLTIVRWGNDIRLMLDIGEIHPECFGHPDQLGHRSSSHFLHKMTAVHFHRNLAEPDLSCDLFAH